VFHALCYVCRSSSFDETFDEVHLEVRSGSNTFYSQTVELSTLAVVDTGEWTLLEIDGIVPTGSTSVRVYLFVDYSSPTPVETTSVWVDDIQLFIVGRKT